MKGLLKSKLVLSLVTVLLLVSAIVIPLSGSITHSFAKSRSSLNIAYLNYDDSGFTESGTRSANIFSDAVVGGPSPTGSTTASVTYNGMTFTPLTKAALSTATLAPYDTLILFEVCDIATSLTASQHAAINAYLAAGNKILLYDADRCAPVSVGAGAAGTADYSWFTFPFSTSAPGPLGQPGTLTIVEKSTLTTSPNILANDPFNSDELGDANTATTSDPHWFAAAQTRNASGNTGFFLAYARNKGLIIYDGADHWNTISQTKSLTDLFINELDQQYDPDNLPSTTPIAPSKTLFVLLQGIDTTFNGKPGTFTGFDQSATKDHPEGIVPFLRDNPMFQQDFPNAQFLEYSYPIDFPSGTSSQQRQAILEQEHPYSCVDTFTHTFDQDVRTLNLQLEFYLNQPGNANTNVYLISHSQGGAVAFGYLAYLESHNWPSLPNGGQLKGVITLDSPIGGVPDNIYSFGATVHYRNSCPDLVTQKQVVVIIRGKKVKETVPVYLPLRSLDNFIAIFNTANNPPAHPQGGKASILSVVSPVFGGGVITNQQVARDAKQHGVSILTVGNLLDFLWDPNSCGKAYPSFLSTQWVADQGSGSGIYGRTFSAGKQTCDTIFNAGDNHFVVLTDKNVEQALLQFINGGTPNALTAADPTL